MMVDNAPESLDPTMKAVQDSMLEGFGQLADYFGFNRVMGQLYASLSLSPDPLSLDDLVNILGKSKASVSMNIRTLEHMGIVREVWVRDTRKKFYEAETDIWKIITNVMSSRELRDIDRALDVLENNIQQLRVKMPDLPDDNRELAQYYIERIDQLSDFFRFARLVLTSILEYGKDFSVVDFMDIQMDDSEASD